MPFHRSPVAPPVVANGRSVIQPRSAVAPPTVPAASRPRLAVAPPAVIQPRSAGFHGAPAAPPPVSIIERRVAPVPPPPVPAWAGSAAPSRCAVQPRLAAMPPTPGAPAKRQAVPPPPVPIPGRGRPVQLHPARRISSPPIPARVIQRMEIDDDISDPDRAPIGSRGYNLAASRSVEFGYFSGGQVSKPGRADLAATHVAPDAGIKHTLGNAARNLYSDDEATRNRGADTIDRLVRNVQARNAVICFQPDFAVTAKGIGKPRKGNTAHQHALESSEEINQAHKDFYEKYWTDAHQYIMDQALQALHDALSVAPGNLPDYGLHQKFNQPVSDRYHLNIDGNGTLTPISDIAVDMGLENTGVAVSRHGNNLITRQGGFFPVANLDPASNRKMSAVGYSRTGIDSP
jgi:hypothetical protein